MQAWSTHSKACMSSSKRKGHKPTIYVLDNKCSHATKVFIASQKVQIHMLAPDDHKVSACEPAVKLTKYHVISTIATADESCPL